MSATAGDGGMLTSILAPGPAAQREFQWASPLIEGVAPSARGGHTATIVPSERGGSRIVVFGGHYSEGSEAGFVCCKDLFVLDVERNLWSQPASRGLPPAPRYGHTATLVADRIVVFGGRGDSEAFRDLHALDTSNNQHVWYQGPSSGSSPSARFGHSAVLWGATLVFCGGAKFDGTPAVVGASDPLDVHLLDLSSMVWSSPRCGGAQPTARAQHAAVLLENSNLLVIHGGLDASAMRLTPAPGSEDEAKAGTRVAECYKGDMRVLDLSSLTWFRLRWWGTPPSPRYSHTLVQSRGDLVLFGGWHGAARCAGCGGGRNQHLPSCPMAGVELPEETSNAAAWRFSLSALEWSPLEAEGAAPPSRYGHVCSSVGPHVVVSGGWDGTKPLRDLHVLRDVGSSA